MNAARIIAVLEWIAGMVRVVITLLALYIYVPLVLSFFPWTANWAPKLFSYILDPLYTILRVVLEFIPNLFFLLAIALVTRYVLKALKFIFREIELGNLQFEGFFQEWASPTYKLVRVLVIAFAVVMAFPYLPGSSSPAFQGVSVFLGLLLSLGSSSAIANIVAGVVLTYMRPFKKMDRVKIADTTGDVVEKNLLVTRIRSIKNVEITIPNAMVLSSHIINYSADAAKDGLILHTTVTIGYDIPWRKVHELLQAAAGRTELLIEERPPFILQTALNDFYVAYE
ncbi:MAG: mechanosensitive ion channel, partial [Proteobacteria bacterium]